MNRSGVDDAGLLDAFLRAVSHDLKSPLLTISLSNELLSDATTLTNERAAAARQGLSEGVRELERMLEAVTAISRARKRPLTAERVTVGEFSVTVDPRVLDELSAVAGEYDEVYLDGQGRVCLVSRIPVEIAGLEGDPLHLLAVSLQDHAGTLVERLAAVQAQLTRQGGEMTVAGGRLWVTLPRAS